MTLFAPKLPDQKHENESSVIDHQREKFKFRDVVLFALIALLTAWYVAPPVVRVHYSKEGTDELRLIWNTQHNIHKEKMLPAQATFVTGHIFPNKKFLMMFDWWTEKGLRRCIDITPKWGSALDIYLNETGCIDTARISPNVIARLKACEGDADPFPLRRPASATTSYPPQPQSRRQTTT